MQTGDEILVVAIPNWSTVPQWPSGVYQVKKVSGTVLSSFATVTFSLQADPEEACKYLSGYSDNRITESGNGSARGNFFGGRECGYGVILKVLSPRTGVQCLIQIGGKYVLAEIRFENV